MKWNEEEIKFLKENYSHTDDMILSNKLNRSVYSIRTKANRFLNLKKQRKCVECGMNLTGRSSTILRCDKCSINYKRFYKRNWAECNIDKVKLKQALWRINNYKYNREQLRLWRIKNRERKKQIDKLYHQKIKELENERRRRLSLPLVGGGFRRELELLTYIKILFTSEKIIFHDRKVLNGLELDIFLPNLNLAFEYQGEQHFRFVKYFHGTYERFEEQRRRDLLTKEKCREKEIKLIEIFYYEPLNEQLILSKLNRYGVSTNQLNLMVSNQEGFKTNYEIKEGLKW